MSSTTAIRFDDVTLGYGRRPAVHHLDGEIPAGSLTAIVGPNGAGKSTLLKGVVGTLQPLEGRIEGALADMEHVAGSQPDVFDDGVAVLRPGDQALEDEQLERAWQQIGLRVGQSHQTLMAVYDSRGGRHGSIPPRCHCAVVES